MVFAAVVTQSLKGSMLPMKVNRLKPTILNSNRSTPSSLTGSVAVVALHNVTKYFQSLWGFHLHYALTSVSFEVHRGEVFGLVGPAGSGKSTTLEIIAGHLRPTAGKVRVFGGSPQRTAIKRRIGYFREATRLAPSGFFAFLMKRFAVIAGTPRRGPPSSGESGLRLAQILMKTSDLVVLDEPFASVGSAGRDEVRVLIRKLARSGKTVILSSKTLSDVKDICDRIAVYYGGKVEAVGTFDELLTSPNAVRFLAPVLPHSVSERLLQAIRGDLPPQPPLTLPQDVVESALPSGDHSAETESADSGANKLLASVTRKLVPGPADLNSFTTPDPIDHERLAELTRPTVTALPGSLDEADRLSGPKK